MCKKCGFESAGGKHIRLSRAKRRREEHDDEDDPWAGECYPGAGIRIREGDEPEKPVGYFEANRFPDRIAVLLRAFDRKGKPGNRKDAAGGG